MECLHPSLSISLLSGWTGCQTLPVFSLPQPWNQPALVPFREEWYLEPRSWFLRSVTAPRPSQWTELGNIARINWHTTYIHTSKSRVTSVYTYIYRTYICNHEFTPILTIPIWHRKFDSSFSLFSNSEKSDSHYLKYVYLFAQSLSSPPPHM